MGSTERKRFDRIGWTYTVPNLTPTQHHVLMVIADSCNDEGESWRGTQSLVERTRLSERKVRKAITEMVAMGVLTREARFRDNGSHTSNLLTLQYESPALDGGVGQDVPQGGAPCAPGVGQDVPQGGAPCAPPDPALGTSQIDPMGVNPQTPATRTRVARPKRLSKSAQAKAAAEAEAAVGDPVATVALEPEPEPAPGQGHTRNPKVAARAAREKAEVVRNTRPGSRADTVAHLTRLLAPFLVSDTDLAARTMHGTVITAVRRLENRLGVDQRAVIVEMADLFVLRLGKGVFFPNPAAAFIAASPDLLARVKPSLHHAAPGEDPTSYTPAPAMSADDLLSWG